MFIDILQIIASAEKQSCSQCVQVIASTESLHSHDDNIVQVLLCSIPLETILP